MSRLQYFQVLFSIFRSPFFSRLQSTSPFHFSRLQVKQKKVCIRTTLFPLISANFTFPFQSTSVDISRHQSISIHFNTLHLSKYHCLPHFLFQMHIFHHFWSRSNTFHLSYSVDFSRHQYTSPFQFGRLQ